MKEFNLRINNALILIDRALEEIDTGFVDYIKLAKEELLNFIKEK